MTQPNSQYYHLIGGAQAGLSWADQGFLLRAYYFQRPDFDAYGYVDGESGWFTGVGSRVWERGIWYCLLWAGYGEMSGFIREKGSGVRRSYRIPGAAAAFETGISLGWSQISITHMSFAGLDGITQTRAYVAWPFSYLTLGLGAKI